jgi:hypothetical protein
MPYEVLLMCGHSIIINDYSNLRDKRKNNKYLDSKQCPYCNIRVPIMRIFANYVYKKGIVIYERQVYDSGVIIYDRQMPINNREDR